MLDTGSTIRTSTVPKGPRPKLGMTGGRNPDANAEAHQRTIGEEI